MKKHNISFYIDEINKSNLITKSDCLSKNQQQKDFILIVDDNHIISDSLKRIIKNILDEENLFIELIILQDGFDILKYFMGNEKKIEKIKCIFTDENMDYLNGSEAIKLIRILEKKEKFFHINIISTTCYEDPKQINYILNSGADLVLSKPISKSSIKNTFKKFDIIKE